MPVALIIGAGANIGQACAETFAAAGYKVAVASRSQKLDSSKFPFFSFDAADPKAVPPLFEKVTKEVGVPSVVVYNVYAASPIRDAKFDIDTVEAFQQRMNINTTSPVVAAHEAVKGFEALDAKGKLGPEGATFIFTGNAANEKPFPGFMTLGIGKTASAHMIQSLALFATKDKPFSFYYGDERQADGAPMYNGLLNGDAHAEEYLKLARDPKQGHWQYTFVKGKGYVDFSK
ncbi:NAD(P)-binding protein [Xylariaceae sp. FL1651]|nr:NAD(P)-binding protein [Xylariaceae sp. FL1651]